MAAERQRMFDEQNLDAGSDATAFGALFNPTPRLVRESRRDIRGGALVQTVQSEVIPRLLLAHRAGQSAAFGADLHADIVVELTDLVLTRDTRAATSFVASLQAGGSSVETLYLDLLAPSARRLGEMWTEDVCSFVDVTVALGRLQHVLHDLSPAFHTGARIFPRGRRVVLVPAPGDQHTFGLAMVVQFFRRAGWAVSGEVATATADLVSMVRHDWFALVGFSVSCDARLEALAAGIRLVRRASRNPAIGVMVGGPIFIDRPELAALVGADATAVDGRQATEQADDLVALLAHPR